MKKDLEAELNSWDLQNCEERHIKLEREWVRYPYIIKKLGLKNLLYLKEKEVLDIGSGPMGGLLQFLPCKKKISLDPLNDEYLKLFPEFYNPNIEYITGKGENIPLEDKSVSLVTCTNAIDHTENPQQVIKEIKRVLKPSGYLAVLFCINLSKIHPHPAHTISIDKSMFLEWVNTDFETIKCQVVKYGWINFQGKCGQPAIYYLGRLTKE